VWDKPVDRNQRPEIRPIIHDASFENHLPAGSPIGVPILKNDAIAWADPERHRTFDAWLASLVPAHGLRLESLRLASADASFRRYLRIDGQAVSFIVMDAPPALEDCRPFVKVAALMADAGVAAPRVLAWNEAAGFMLLTDLGAQTLMELIAPPADVQAIAEPTALHHALVLQAVDALIAWQLSSRPGVLPPYDDALLSRELQLFPDWYVKQHRGLALDGGLQDKLDALFAQIKASNLASLGGARVFVHRDFMARNLMVMPGGGQFDKASDPEHSPAQQGPRDWLCQTAGAAAPSGGSALHEVKSVGVLDFQDAVYGPITYDIASLMRDAFLSWDESFVLDITVRYWKKARLAGLPVGDDFGEFYRAVEWMGLQRHLKILGIFARLTLRDGKPKYLADTPRFIGYARATCARYRALGPLMVLLDEIEGNETRVGYTF
jgi:N-acetylmuramate 1-kinase